jgi:outer membrane protein assembly factor BamB
LVVYSHPIVSIIKHLIKENSRKMKNILLAVTMLSLISCTSKNELSQWRGPNRDGKYLETGLLKLWPADGPKMHWSYEGLGAGHGSPAVVGDRIFVLGMPDTMGVIYCLDMDGELLWQKEYGLEWYANYTGPRSTPTITGGLLYFVSGQGVVFCMETETGEVLWSVDMFEKFGAQKTRWGIAESPLLDGDRIILTPGGKEHNVVALDRFTGERVWSSEGNGEPSAFCSPILVEHNETRLIVTMTAESVLGIDADKGRTLWRIEHRQSNEISANSPVYDDGRLFCATASGDSTDGHIMIQLSEDGETAELGWRNEECLNLMGGIIVHEGSVYSSRNRRKEFYSIDAGTGNINYISDKVSGGVTIFADGLFYCYGTNGVMALVEANEHDCRVISSFSVPLGTDQHWAHPVIHDRRLYIHHGDALICYELAGKNL